MRKFIIAVMLLSLLTACKSKEEPAPAKEEKATVGTEIKDQDKKDAKEKSVDPTTESFSKEKLDKLIEASDYISRVKINMGGNSVLEDNFIRDYKGDLSTLEFKLPKTLKPNTEYIIFYRDSSEGEIIPTDGDSSFVEIMDQNDQNLNYIEKILVKESIQKDEK